MQFFWLYMDELIGKGIEIWTIVQLLVYMSATLVPLALPLSLLLASIMTFGNMGENFELVAIKSSGISFLRFMRPLFIFILFMCGLAFLFNNNVIPVANLKALSLLYDVRNAKPALNIKPDQFNNEIQGYSIRVGSKDEDGNTIHDIMIYDHSDMMGNNKVILAKEGKMMASPDKQSLIFKLTDGWRYEEGYTRGTLDMTQTRMHFAHWDKVFDLSAFKFTRNNEDLFKNAYQMYNVSQLSQQIDSLARMKVRNMNSIRSLSIPFVTVGNGTQESLRLDTLLATAHARTLKYDSSFVQLVDDSEKTVVVSAVLNNLRNMKAQVDNVTMNRKFDDDNYLKYEIEWHRKFTLSFACVLLFLIGAPLGAIIRKGGLGMPLVFAVVFFMVFHIFNIIGEKLAKSVAVAPWLGMWLSTIVLLPLAIWLVVSARNDAQIFTKEWYIRLWRRIKYWIPLKKNEIGAVA